jgi:shikimate dehydrogenase
MIKLFGLIGNPLTHSYSKEYFNLKFQAENLTDHQYQLFPLTTLTEFRNLVTNYTNLLGLNVTIPFKKQILNYLDQLSPEAIDTGAVNCINIDRSFRKPFLTGYNTDIYGFEQSIKPLLKALHKKALILGTGGSASAVAYVLKSLQIKFSYVSRNPSQENQINYDQLDIESITKNLIIINTTPVGMFPHTDICPDIPYYWITADHLLFDLIYNPEESLFLKKGKQRGALIKNGLQMLHLQAEKSWEIWQD